MTPDEHSPRSKVLGIRSWAGHSLAHARNPSIAVRRRFGPGPGWETVPFCRYTSIKRCINQAMHTQMINESGRCTAGPWQAWVVVIEASLCALLRRAWHVWTQFTSQTWCKANGLLTPSFTGPSTDQHWKNRL